MRRQSPICRVAALLLALGVAGCESSLPLFGRNEPEKTADAREFCPETAELDMNGDGSVDAGEFSRAGTALFSAWDDTEDGLLSYSEFNDCFEGRPENLFEVLDVNHDHMVVPEEFLALFAIWDADRDGHLREDEVRFAEIAGG